MTPLPDGPDAAGDLIARDLAAVWHPCAQMSDYQRFAPLPVVSASGCRITLADGRVLLDAISSWWCKALGHGHPRLLAALVAQAQRFEHVILANTTHEGIVGLSERLLAMANGHPLDSWGPGAAPGRLPGRFGKVFFADNGSTAVEIAVKMAIQAQAQRGAGERTGFAALRNGYHGETVATLSVGDCGLYGEPYRALMFPVTMVRDVPYRSGPADPRWRDAGAEWAAIEAQLAPLAGRLAAVVYEPVLQGAGGMLPVSPDLLPRLRRWADGHGVYLIADEIAAGMGRCGAMLASHLADAEWSPARWSGREALPDFAVVSKGLTGGVLPLSAVLTSDAIYDLFWAEYHDRKAFLHSNTWTGNALAVAVANAALDVFVEEDVLGRVARNGAMLREGMAELARSRPWLRNVRGVGMMAAADLTEAGGAALDPRKRTGFAVYQAAVRRGALLRNLGDTMYLFPPLNTDPADLQAMLTILGASVDEVMGG